MELVIREAQSLIRSQSHRVVEGDTCFHCRKQGHWARDCPYKAPDRKPTSLDSSDFPVIQCRCGAGTCLIRISNTPRNPGRKFCSCPAKMGEKCNFFKWCDMITDYEISKAPQFPQSPQSPQVPIPMCSCGAGICSISMERMGPNEGKRYFICPVKKMPNKLLEVSVFQAMPQGQGACNFFQWEDDLVNTKVNDIDEMKQCSTEQSSEISQQDTEKGKSCSPKEEASSFQHLERVEDSPAKEDSCSSNPEAVLGPLENCDMLVIENGGHDETAKFQHSLKLHYAADVTSLEDLVYQILRFRVLGWLGRLAFPPPRCLTVPPPKPFLCCVFPSYDPIFVPQEVKYDVVSDRSQTPSALLRITHGQNAQTVDVLLEASGLKNPSIILGGNAIISGPILEAFQQAALRIQNELIFLLESMDPLDHESMVREANSALAGLDHLGMDYRPFYERVKKFISCSSALSQIESTINNDYSSQQLMDSYRRQISHYEKISRVHSKGMTALTSSDDRLRSLQKEAIRFEQMLGQIETRLSCCEVETAVLEIHLQQISQDMSESKQNLDAVYEEAGQAIELQRQREAERSTAKEAMERARVQLRQ